MQQHVGPQQSFVHWQRKRREVFKGLGDNEATTARPEQRPGFGVWEVFESESATNDSYVSKSWKQTD